MMRRRVINFINFIRYDEPRLEMDLLTPVKEQIKLLKEAELPCTWLLQYDALAAGPYVDLLKAEMPAGQEVGLWFEINRMHCDDAGVEFHGRAGWNWDYHSNASLSIGYTQDERIKLADQAMKKFREVWGYYPKSVAAWYIDAFTLDYLGKNYDISASANCKEQYGTDGYTLWGGFFSGGYYPSKNNALLPACDSDNQITVPVFRMLGADPIHQYDSDIAAEAQQVVTLEPVWKNSGGQAEWVRKFLDMIASSPCMTLNYAQAGQENSFGWPAMKDGYLNLVDEIKNRRNAGLLIVETLQDTGNWFQKNFKNTPAQTQIALEDTLAGDRRTIWYESRFYRANVIFDGDEIGLRDFQIYRDDYSEPFLEQTCDSHDATIDALPIIDGYRWSSLAELAKGQWYAVDADGNSTNLKCTAVDEIKIDEKTLAVKLKLQMPGWLVITFEESEVSFELIDCETTHTLKFEISWAEEVETSFARILDDKIVYEHNKYKYLLNANGAGVCNQNQRLIIASQTDKIKLSV